MHMRMSASATHIAYCSASGWQHAALGRVERERGGLVLAHNAHHLQLQRVAIARRVPHALSSRFRRSFSSLHFAARAARAISISIALIPSFAHSPIFTNFLAITPPNTPDRRTRHTRHRAITPGLQPLIPQLKSLNFLSIPAAVAPACRRPPRKCEPLPEKRAPKSTLGANSKRRCCARSHGSRRRPSKANTRGRPRTNERQRRTCFCPRCSCLANTRLRRCAVGGALSIALRCCCCYSARTIASVRRHCSCCPAPRLLVVAWRVFDGLTSFTDAARLLLDLPDAHAYAYALVWRLRLRATNPNHPSSARPRFDPTNPSDFRDTPSGIHPPQPNPTHQKNHLCILWTLLYSVACA